MATFIDIPKSKKDEYNKVVSHPLQSYEWGEFREKTGVKVIRRGLISNNNLASGERSRIIDGTRPELVDGFTLTLHRTPKTNFNIGYLPKGNLPTEELISELKKIGKENNCIFIQLEPNVEKYESGSMNQGKVREGVTQEGGLPTSAHVSEANEHFREGKPVAGPRAIENLGITPSHHPLFTKYTFEIDLTKTEEELLKEFGSKTRYNIRLASKKGVKVEIDDSEKSFEKYLELTNETTKRQKFYAHTPDYHKKMWSVLYQSPITNHQSLSAHLLVAKFENEILTTWVLFVFKDTLYYPYGASSAKHRNLMASNLVMWEAIKFGKKLGLKKFDLWGALGPDADARDPWYGFHKFKMGYNPRHVEFVGSYDLVINQQLYHVFKIMDKVRWFYLKLKTTIR